MHPANMHAADVGREPANSRSPNMHAAAKRRATDMEAATADVHPTTADVHATPPPSAPATTADMHSTATAKVRASTTATDVHTASTTAAPSWKRRGRRRQQYGRSQQHRAQSNQMSTHRVLPSFRQRRERGASHARGPSLHCAQCRDVAAVAESNCDF